MHVSTGAAKRIRTPDPRITNALLYQLSYCGMQAKRAAILTRVAIRRKAADPLRDIAQRPGQREYDVFFPPLEFLDPFAAPLAQLGDDTLDQYFGSRRAGRHPDGRYSVEPFAMQLLGPVDQIPRYAGFVRHLPQAIRI